MSEKRQTPADGPVSQETPALEPIYLPEFTLSSLTSHKPKPLFSARSKLARIAALSFQSKRVPLASIPLNEYGRNLLLSVLAEIKTLPALANPLGLAEARDLGIAYKPAQWDSAPLDYARRQAYSRAALRLENLGVLRRITERHRDRVTHVQLTATGLRLALWLAGRRADRSAIAEGLRLTNWGKELAAKIRVKPRQDKQVPEETIPHRCPSRMMRRTCGNRERLHPPRYWPGGPK